MRGHQGESVRDLQRRLNEQGANLSEDGIFGTKTEEAVRTFQTRARLTPDGMAGRETVRALEQRSFQPINGNDEVEDTSTRSRRNTVTGGTRSQPAQPPVSDAPVVRATDARPQQPGQRPTLPAGLTAENRAQLDDALSGRLGAQASGAVTALMTSPAYQRLQPQQQAAALASLHAPAPPAGGKNSGGGMLAGMLGNAPPDVRGRLLAGNATQLRTFLQTPGVQNAAPADQQRILEVYQRAGIGRGDLQTVAARSPGLLEQDARGGRLIDSLHSMATGPLAPGLETQRGFLLSSTLEGVVNPERITQEARGTCTVTSMSQMLARQNPAEYARLVAGLSTPRGEVALRNGDLIRREPGTDVADNSGRTPAERLLQPALMEYGNGAAGYDNATDTHTAGNRTLGGGLYATESRRVMTGLFGTEHEVVGQLGYDRSLNARPEPPPGFFDRLRAGGQALWDGMTFRRNTENPSPMEVLRERSGRDTLIGMRWSESGGHAVVVDRIQNGRVYFRNPQGNGGGKIGSSLTDPPRRVENGGSMQSMTEAEFARRLTSVVVPAR